MLIGCGGSSHPAAPETPAASPKPPASHASRARDRPLLYVWRNFELTGIPEDMTIYADGRVRYRNLLHTQQGIPVQRVRLRHAQLRTLRKLLGAVDLERADASGVKPRRDGYRYVIRSHGRVGTAADGHLHGPIRPLVIRLRAQMDRLRRSSL